MSMAQSVSRPTGGPPERDVCFQFHGIFGGLFSVSVWELRAAPVSSREAPFVGIHV